MSTHQGSASPASRTLSQALTAAGRAAVYCGALGALDGAFRLYVEPSLYGSRLDALIYAIAAVALPATLGLLLGFPCGLILARRWGEVASSFWPPAFAGLAWLLAIALEPILGTRPGAWIAVIAAATLALGVVAVASAVTPADGLVLGPRERSHRRLLLAPIILPLLLLSWLGGRPLLDRRRPPEGSPNLLLITVDTLRADAVGAMRDGRPIPPGLERARTERLDHLADSSFRFMEASTPIPKTPQAIASLLTGNYPARHAVRDLFSSLDESKETLAEILRSRGWATHAVVTNGLIGRGSGFEQGFDRYYDKDGLRPQMKRLALVDLTGRLWPFAMRWSLNRFTTLRIGRETARETTDRALETMEGLDGRPWFLWVHYLDPHWIYWPPEPYRSEADTRPGSPLTVYDDIKEGRLKIGEMIHRNGMSSEEVERLSALYAGEVTYNDQEIGRLLDVALEGSSADSTLILFTSDHGESLGEHAYFFSHGDLVYEPSMRVPLLVRPPGGAAGRQVTAPVSLVDLMPTMLEILGVASPGGLDGTSLTALMTHDVIPGETSATRPVYGESDLSYLKENPHLTIPGEAGKIRFIRSGRYKLVRTPRDTDKARLFDPDLGAANSGRLTIFGFGEATQLGSSAPDRIALYDLSQDPLELTDISGTDPDLTDAMVRALDTWLQGTLAGGGTAREGNQELLEELRSLGYVDGSGEEN